MRLDDLDSADAINAEVWDQSVELQTATRAPFRDPQADVLQALLPEGPLPWVPDLVGAEWREPRTVFVVGSAYAPFIEGMAGRTRAMSLGVYVNAPSATAFQRAFLRDVVNADASYYAPISRLIASVVGPARRAVLLDLVRGSFVDRRTLAGGDSALRAAPDLFMAYARAGWGWTWRRMVESASTDILVLGQRAERGLLVLLAGQGASIRVAGTGERPARGTSILDSASTRSIGDWLRDQTWWEAVAEVNGRERRWRVLPIVHPARANQHDARYEKTIALARRMTSGERPGPQTVPPAPRPPERRTVGDSRAGTRSAYSAAPVTSPPQWMPSPGKATQRDVMRRVWARWGPDEGRVVGAYAAEERAGVAPRRSNTRGESAEDYARRLLYDGIKKGWL